MKDLIVKSNKLNSVIQNLSLSEIRIIQLGIINARETGILITTDTPIRVDALAYAKKFNVSRQTAYEIIKQAEDRLFNRRFSFISERNNKVKSSWVHRVEYLENEGAIEINFSTEVIKEITRLDGKEQFFTSYLLIQTSKMDSNYSVRLYELLVQWKKAGKTPLFELQLFREQLGVEKHEYKAMCDFKKRVLDLGIKEINKKSDLKVSYKQETKGRKIIGFKFTIRQKPRKDNDIIEAEYTVIEPIPTVKFKQNIEHEIIKQKADEYIAKMNITDENHKQNIYRKALAENWGIDEYNKEQAENEKYKKRLEEEKQRELEQKRAEEEKRKQAQKEFDECEKKFLKLPQVMQKIVLETLENRLPMPFKKDFKADLDVNNKAYRNVEYSGTFKQIMKDF